MNLSSRTFTMTAALFGLGLLLISGSSVSAQSTTTSPSAELREIIKQRLEKTLEAPQEARFIGVVGSVMRVTASTFTLVDPNGRERTVILDTTTSFATSSAIKSLKDLSIDAGVAVIGNTSDDVVIQARRVIPATTPFNETRRVALGSVQTLERNSVTLVERGNGQITSVTIAPTTKFEDILGNTVPRTALQKDESVLIVIDTAGDKLTAKRIRLLVAATQE